MKPLMVKVTDEDAGIAAPEVPVVMTTEVAVVAPKEAPSDAMLLLPIAMVGVTDETKKPDG